MPIQKSVTVNKRKYKVRQGKKGGLYILKQGKKKYLSNFGMNPKESSGEAADAGDTRPTRPLFSRRRSRTPSPLTLPVHLPTLLSVFPPTPEVYERLYKTPLDPVTKLTLLDIVEPKRRSRLYTREPPKGLLYHADLTKQPHLAVAKND